MSKKVKKLILSLNTEYSLFGIQTNAPPHKLVYYLNKELNIAFKRDKDIDFLENNKIVYLNKYTYYDLYKEQDWTLVTNETQTKITNSVGARIFNDELYTNVHLIPEFKMFNYILKIDGQLDKKKEKMIKMNNILIINIVSIINQSLIRNKAKLIF